MGELTRNAVLAVFLAAFASVTSTSVFAGGMANDSAEDAISYAKAAQKRAASVKGEWRDTGKMIKKAEKLLATGKSKEAAKLANKAREQALLGYEQASSQASRGLHI
jgi:hypothetical protein